jgi:putative Mn2+ efflux pump MntP
MDAMSVSAAIGVKWHGPRQRFRLAWHMGLFQFAMPLAGYFLGSRLAGGIQAFGSVIAGLLVAGLGAKMLYESLKTHPADVTEKTEHAVERLVHTHPKDPTRGWSLIVLSVADSIDALVAGFSLGISRQQDGGIGIFLCSLIIGIVTAVMSLIGVIIGQRAGQAFGRWAELAGAVVLIGVGISLAVM